MATATGDDDIASGESVASVKTEKPGSLVYAGDREGFGGGADGLILLEKPGSLVYAGTREGFGGGADGLILLGVCPFLLLHFEQGSFHLSKLPGLVCLVL